MLLLSRKKDFSEKKKQLQGMRVSRDLENKQKYHYYTYRMTLCQG